jgi:hypothetical protein
MNAPLGVFGSGTSPSIPIVIGEAFRALPGTPWPNRSAATDVSSRSVSARAGFPEHRLVRHTTTGSATVSKLDDGRTAAPAASNVSASNDPKAHVTSPIIRLPAVIVEDAKSVDLTDFKGKTGDQNYVIPANVNLDDMKTSRAVSAQRATRR